jgi:RNA polymerase sigma factor (sigma-70 family)
MTGAQAGLVLQHIRRLDAAPGAVQLSDAQLLERFTTRRDETAFAALVRRHGPMVLNVCRSVLRHEQDAEDAFQATFLVLARKADAIRQRAAVAGWLYEVAHHVAAKARADAARRRVQARGAAPAPPADPTLDMTLRDLHQVLHRELRRLPDRYRLPLVLCYLEGRSHEEAAGLLGWSPGTFRGRLDRGREHLRRRLAARGVALSALLCASVVAPRVAAESLMRAASSGTTSARATVLADRMTRTVVATRLKVAAAAVLVAGLVSAAGLSQRVTAGDEPPKQPAAAKPQGVADAQPAPADNKDTLAYSGRVLGPDGKPVAGAKLYLTHPGGYDRKASPTPESATTGADGRFEFTVSRHKFDGWSTVVAATAANYGVAWVQIRPSNKTDNLTLQLVDDGVPITGQIVDLEGKPIRGVILTMTQVNAAPGEDLDPWLEAARGKKDLALELELHYLPRYTNSDSRQVTTDADGRFRLTGIGRNRLVHAQLDGPTIASQKISFLTRPGKSIEVAAHKERPEYGEPGMFTTYYGSDFRHVAAPCQPIVGVVRDRDTKKPLAGVTVRSYALVIGRSKNRILDTVVLAKTDAEGRYRLTGMPKGKGYSVAAIPGSDLPYLPVHADVPDGTGLDPVTVDIELRRGVWIEGKLTDKVTGKPLKGAVEYFSLYSNPNRSDYPGFDGTVLMGHLFVPAKEDGSYRVVGLPGPGLIGVYYQRGSYLRVDERDDEFGTKEKSLETSPYHISFTSNYNALAKVDPAKGADSVKRDITLDPGWTFTGTVLGRDGKPLTGALCLDLNSQHWWNREPMKTAEFAGWFKPQRPYDILFLHAKKGLVGVGRPPKENGGTVTVRMEPGAAVTGRLVDADGRPRAGVELELNFLPKGWGSWWDYPAEHIRTDRSGRFQIEGLVTGQNYRLSDDWGELLFGEGLASGNTKDLGDVHMGPRPPRRR